MKLFLFLLGLSMANASQLLPDFDSWWNYAKPAETEARFREFLPEMEKKGSPDLKLQLQTQLARTQSLQKKFKEAHEILDAVEKKLSVETTTAEVRYLLERGRCFNSDNQKEKAIPLFTKAWELGQKRGLDNFAVDAAHMMAIAEKEPAKQMEWNKKAVALAEKSQDQKARNWLGSLYNNIGWTLHDQGKLPEALATFKKALEFQEKRGDPSRIRIAKWAVARAHRSLKQYDEALEIQKALEAENAKENSPDGYVFEEIGELLLATNHPKESKPYFARAFELLSQDIWLKDSEPKRLARLKELSN